MKLTLLLRYFAKLLIPTIRLLPKEFQNLFITLVPGLPGEGELGAPQGGGENSAAA